MNSHSDAGPNEADDECEAHSNAFAKHASPSADGLHFFSHTVDGQWRGGWFRVRNGQLEVYAAGQVRTASLTDLRDPAGLLRKLLTEMVRQRH